MCRNVQLLLSLLLTVSPLGKPDSILVSAGNRRQECPVTRAAAPPFRPPPPFPAAVAPSDFWFGTEALWTILPVDGVWRRLPQPTSGYVQKMAWFSNLYNSRSEPRPAIAVVGRRLDNPAPPLTVLNVSNAHTETLPTVMTVQVNVPSLGCWEITGKYREHKLLFVVLVTQ
jgi:hypothetical protein